MKRAIFAMTLACAAIALADTVIIENGKPTNACFCNQSAWTATENGLRGTGSDCPIFSWKTFDAGELEISARLSLERLNGCAPRFTIGDVNCGIDGGTGTCFIERQYDKPKLLQDSAAKIEAGKPFTVLIQCSGGNLRFNINGVFIGDFNYSQAKQLSISFNPWRATASLQDFRVRGTENGLYSPPRRNEFCADLVSIHEDAITAPVKIDGQPFEQNKGKTYVQLCEGPITLAECNVKCDGSRITFPQGFLKEAYAKSTSPSNVRALTLFIYPWAASSIREEFVLMLHDPDSQPVPAKGEVVYENGVGAFVVNGVNVGTFSGTLGNMGTQTAGYDLGKFSDAGVDGVIVLLSAFQFMDKEGNLDENGFRLHLQKKFMPILAYNPKAYFKIYFDLCMPQEWCKAHPEELIRLDNGKETLQNAPMRGLQPSYASTAWRQTMGKALAQCIAVFQSCPFADRLPYLRLCYANCGEWNHWGYHEEAFVDFSKPMQRAFSQYLEEKYGTVGKLRAAWGRQDVSFADNLIPDRASRLKGGDYLRANGPEGMPSVDYYTFFQKLAADTITHFAHIAKEASSRKMIVGSYYGYYFGHYAGNPYHFQDSGNYGVSYILQSPDMDFIGGPYPYDYRNIHQCVNGVASSIRLHKKLWENENDERTHFSGTEENIYGTTANLQETIAICKRNYMLNIGTGTCMYYYDFIRDWYRDNMDVIAALRRIDKAVRRFDMKSRAKVAFLLSERTIPFYSSQAVRNSALVQAHHFLQYELPFLGMPVELFLLSDIKNIDFSQFNVVVFPNCLYADDAIINDIRKYAAGGNRTLLFLHAPGAINASNNIDEPQMKRLTGISMKVQPDVKYGVLENPYYKIDLPPTNFRTIVDDANAKALAKWDDGSVAMAERQFKDWKSVVLCHQAPSAIFLREFLSKNGAMIWSSGRCGLNQCSFAGPLLSMYSRNGGNQSFWLPQPVEIAADVFTGQIYAENSPTIDFKMEKGPNTTIIFAGRRSDYEAFKKEIAAPLAK